MAKASQKKQDKMIVSTECLLSELNPAITQLGALPIKNIDVLTNIAKFKRAIKEEVKLYTEIHKQISEVDCEKDKNGNPILETVAPGRQLYKYKSETIESEVFSRIKQLNEKKVEIEYTPIKSSDLKNVEGLSGNVLEALGDFIQYE